jgi:hypothetical protein
VRKSWFFHTDLTTTEANELISRYNSRNIQTKKTLSADPRLWNVAALLPEYAKEPRVSNQYQHKMWS